MVVLRKRKWRAAMITRGNYKLTKKFKRAYSKKVNIFNLYNYIG